MGVYGFSGFWCGEAMFVWERALLGATQGDVL